MDNMTLYLNPQDFQKISDALLQLSTIDKNKIIQQGLKEGVSPVITQGRLNLASRNKVRKGNLKNSFKRVYKKSQGKVYAGFSRPSGAAAHLVDRGTVKRWTKKGYYRGYISKAKGMNRGSSCETDAVEDKGPEGLEKLYNSIRDAIDQIISK